MAKAYRIIRLIRDVRNSAAVTIQRAWMSYRDEVVIPRNEHERKFYASLIIQCYSRGYIARKSIAKELSLWRINNVYEHFKKINHQL